MLASHVGSKAGGGGHSDRTGQGLLFVPSQLLLAGRQTDSQKRNLTKTHLARPNGS